MKKMQKFVLLIDCDCEEAQRTGIELAVAEVIFWSHEEQSRRMNLQSSDQPSRSVIPQSQANVDSKILPQVLLEFSPEAEIVWFAASDPAELGRSAMFQGHDAELSL